MPDWLLPTGFVALCLVAWIGFAWRNTLRQIARTSAKRPNPSREEFDALLGSRVSRASADFLWETMMFHLQPRLTPHPDDDLVRDLPIDSDDWSMEWPRDFAIRRGFDESAFPDWPKDVPVTVRNFARWLDLGERRAKRRG